MHRPPTKTCAPAQAAQRVLANGIIVEPQAGAEGVQKRATSGAHHAGDHREEACRQPQQCFQRITILWLQRGFLPLLIRPKNGSNAASSCVQESIPLCHTCAADLPPLKKGEFASSARTACCAGFSQKVVASALAHTHPAQACA